MRRILVGLCILYSAFNAYAFEPHFYVREFDETFSHMTINQIFQTGDCMIWLGTDEGLMQYTGTQLNPIPYPDSTQPLSVTAMFEDHQGILWVGTATGHIFQYQSEPGLTLWKIEEGLPKVQITGFLEDPAGQLWIATYGEGLYVYSKGRLYNINSDDGLPDDEVYAITIDGKGRTWAATDNGISLCSYDSAKHITQLTVRDGLPDQIVRCMRPDHLGNVWIGTYEGGIAYYDVMQEKITQVKTARQLGQITCIGLFETLELWIGTQDNGLWKYEMSSGNFCKMDGVESLRNNEIRSLLKDVEGNLWVVSGTNTVLTAYRPFEIWHIPVGNIQAIMSTAPDRLWIGTDQGLFLGQEDTAGAWSVSQIPGTPFTSVASLARDQAGNIWIGSLDIGLCVYQPDRKQFRIFDNVEYLANNPVISFFIEHDHLWLATLGKGIVHARIHGDVMNGGYLQLIALAMNGGSSHNFVFQVTPRGDGTAWLATDGEGLMFADDGDISGLPARNEGPRTVYAVTGDKTGHLWMITPESGLDEYDGKSFRPMGIQEGLRSVSISSIVTSYNGEILIAHNKGIDLLIPERRHLMYFDDDIGLSAPSPVLNAVAKDTTRTVWIGMQNAIVRYTSLSEDLSIHPRTKIEHVSVNQFPIDYHVHQEFNSHQNFFAFDYVGLWYTEPQSVKYLYTLEGHDLHWKESADHLAIYSNLKPGKYTFKVKASENKFFYDEPLAEYAFEIHKPFWQKLWFIVLAVFTAGFLIYLYIKNREARLRRIEDLNKEKIESQFRALKAQINPHFLFNSFNTLITIIDENATNPEVAIEYVEKLADFYRSILQYREEEAISIPEEIHLVKNYCYLLQQRYGETLILDVDTGEVQGYVPPLTLQMLVENAVKHNVISKSQPLTIRIYNKNDQYLVVENNIQKKLTAVSSTKFGLQNIVKRYQLISDKKVLIEETKDVFRVSIPIIKTLE